MKGKMKEELKVRAQDSSRDHKAINNSAMVSCWS